MIVLTLNMLWTYLNFDIEFLVFIKQVDATSPNYFLNVSKKPECKIFDNNTRTLNICDGQVNLSKINQNINDTSILNKIGDKEWFLNANIFVMENSTFFINATDTSWLKINSTKGTAYWIVSEGNLSIDNTRISSWNSSSNSETNLDTTANTIPRSFILAPPLSNGNINITNSYITHLGYATYTPEGSQSGYTTGISYFGGNGSIIRNNVFTDNYRGWYATHISDITFRDNIVANSIQYGLDPHSGSENLQIINNTVYNSGSHGIICSRMCENILIEQNIVHNSIGHGIDLDQSITDSVVKGNTVYNNTYGGIAIWNSSANTVTNNSIYNNTYGILVTRDSHDNTITNNEIRNSKIYGIYLYSNSSFNRIINNIINQSEKSGITLRNDTTNHNKIDNNTISGSTYGILFQSSPFNVLSNNKVLNSKFDFAARGNSTNAITYTQFNTTTFKLLDNQSSFVIINENQTVLNNNKKIDNIILSDKSALFIENKGNFKIEPLDMHVYPTSNYVNITSLKKDMETAENRIRWIEVTSDPRITTKYVIGGQIPNSIVSIHQLNGDNKQIKANSTGHIVFISDYVNGERGFALNPGGIPLTKVLLLIFIAPIGVSIILLINYKKRRKIMVGDNRN